MLLEKLLFWSASQTYFWIAILFILLHFRRWTDDCTWFHDIYSILLHLVCSYLKLLVNLTVWVPGIIKLINFILFILDTFGWHVIGVIIMRKFISRLKWICSFLIWLIDREGWDTKTSVYLLILLVISSSMCMLYYIWVVVIMLNQMLTRILFSCHHNVC